MILENSVPGEVTHKRLFVPQAAALKPSERHGLSSWAPRVFGGATALVGLISLVGWLLWMPLLSGGWLIVKTPMSPTAAVLFVLFGAGLASLPGLPSTARRVVATAVGGTVAVFSVLCLADLAFGWGIHFDRWALYSQMARHHILDKVGMAPTSSIGFVLAGGGFVLLENGGLLRSNVGQWGIVLALMVALAALIGHFYQALGLYELGQLLPMALSTAVNFILLALGMFALRPDVGFVSVLTAPNLGGAMARRLFGAVIVLPPLLGFISLSIMRGLALDPAGGVGLLVTMTGLALAIAVVISAHRLEKTADALTERSRELEIARLDADGANRAKSEFLANMSHELRTPLNAVIGFSEIMREARFGPIDNRYREYSGHIHDSGNHLLAMVNQILDLAKVEAGQLTLCEETVLLQDLAARCLTVIRERSVRAGSSLVNRIPADFPAIRGDELRLRQVLLNLLSNAVKFTGRGGAITLDAQIHADDTFEITVADTGIGMNAQQLAFVFLPFQQVDTPNSRRQEGTGLGLPLARALVEQHGGTLMLESSPGIGTLARVRLPANRLLGAGPGAATSASS